MCVTGMWVFGVLEPARSACKSQVSTFLSKSVQTYHTGSLQSAMVEVFMPWQPADVCKPEFTPTPSGSQFTSAPLFWGVFCAELMEAQQKLGQVTMRLLV